MKDASTSYDHDTPTIDSAAEALRAGELVVFPTETVYGLGADAWNDSAVRRIFAVKGRPADNPLIVHVASLEGVAAVAAFLPDDAVVLFESFSPGPLTLVLPAHPDLPRIVTAVHGTVAVRIPHHPVARQLLERTQRPVAAPSANRSGEPSPTTLAMARRSLGDTVRYYLDGGPCEVGLESTVASVGDAGIVILRPGAVTAEDISLVLPGSRVRYAGADAREGSARSPGTRHRHYQPRARVMLCDPARVHLEEIRSVVEECAAQDGDGDRGNYAVGVMGLTKDADALEKLVVATTAGRSEVASRGARDNLEYARGLYRWFGELDDRGVGCILATPPAVADGIGRALADRLDRASGGTWVGSQPLPRRSSEP